MKKTRRHGTRGGGYGFGGSILADAGGANAGSALWNSSTGADCGVSSDRGGNGMFAGGRRRTRRSRRGGNPLNASLYGRGGNHAGGGKPKKLTQKAKKKKEREVRQFRKRGGSITAELGGRGGNGGSRRRGGSRGGNGSDVDLAQMSPRTGYAFDGTGIAGTPNTIPI